MSDVPEFEADEERCWVCLSPASAAAGPLRLPCKCPSLHSHAACLARWQMQNSGKQEEIACRFCHQSLPPWPYALLSCESANVCAAESDRDSAKHATSSTSIDVLFEDRVVSIPCLPGKLGAEMFERQVRHVFSLDPTVRLDVTFEVEAPALAPTLGDTVWLSGFEYFDVAFQVASVAAKMYGGSSSRCCSDPQPLPSGAKQHQQVRQQLPRRQRSDGASQQQQQRRQQQASQRLGFAATPSMAPDAATSSTAMHAAVADASLWISSPLQRAPRIGRYGRLRSSISDMTPASLSDRLPDNGVAAVGLASLSASGAVAQAPAATADAAAAAHTLNTAVACIPRAAAASPAASRPHGFPFQPSTGQKGFSCRLSPTAGLPLLKRFSTAMRRGLAAFGDLF